MASGVTGSLGLNAHDLVAVEFTRVLAHAVIQAPPMEEKIALVAETKPDHVTLTIVQVNFVETAFRKQIQTVVHNIWLRYFK